MASKNNAQSLNSQASVGAGGHAQLHRDHQAACNASQCGQGQQCAQQEQASAGFLQQTGEQVKNMAQGAGEQVKNMAQGAADAVKNTLGMNSENNNNCNNPSKPNCNANSNAPSNRPCN